MGIILLDINELIDSKEELVELNTSCFQYKPTVGNYNFYIFVSEFNNEEELILNYKKVNDIIALEFQAKLIENFEKWNLYIFYLVKNYVSFDVKEVIEQDKYATRKLVFEVSSDNLLIEHKRDLINKKLFSLDISNKAIRNIPQFTDLKKMITQMDPRLVDIIGETKNVKSKNLKEKKMKNSEIIQFYLEMKKYE